MITKLPINLSKIEYIAHIADIHIRLYNRHTEYKEVFDVLYEELKKTPKNTLIYLAGDIVHSKTNLTPELVNVTAEFLVKLSKIRPTILIAGNHDANLKNKYRLDSITPIINIIKENHEIDGNLIYLKENGVYELSNCLFSVMSVFEKSENYITNIEDDSNKYKIALYHGVVDGAKTDLGHKLESSSVNKNTFKNFDFAMLGDIHKKDQSLNIEGTIKYSGSICCQNHGELNDKGFLLWNLKEKTSEFIQLKNNYGYHTLNIDQGEILPKELVQVSKKPYLRLISNNTTNTELNQIIDNLKTRFDIQELVVKTDGFKKDKEKKNTIDFNIENFYNEDYRLKIIQEYIDEFFPNIENLDYDQLKLINKELSQQLVKVDKPQFNWKPISFEFDNMFSFDEGNMIDFSNINDIYGFFGKNYSGKSSTIEALVYCIFDKCPKTNKAVHVLNANKDTFECKFTFELNGLIYTIHRVGKRKNNTVKVDVDFYNEHENLSGEQRAATNNIIRNYLGTYDDFILTTISSQSMTPEFADKSQSERKDILSTFLNLEIFDNLHSMVNDELKESKSRIKYFDIESIISEQDENKTYQHEANPILHESKQLLEQQEKEFKQCESEVVTLSQQIKAIDYKDSITQINIDKSKLDKELVQLNSNTVATQKSILDNNNIIQTYKDKEPEYEKIVIDLQSKLKIVDEELEELNNEKAKTNIDFITQGLKLLDECNDEYKELKFTYDNLIKEIKNKQKAVDGINHIKYDDNCNYCIDNINLFTGNALSYKNALPSIHEKAKDLDIEIEKKSKKIIILTAYKTSKQKYDELISTIYNKTLEINDIHNLIDRTQSDITKNQLSIENVKLSIEAFNVELSRTSEAIDEINNVKFKLIDDRKLQYQKVQTDIENNTIYQQKVDNLIIKKNNRQHEINTSYSLIGQIENKIQELKKALAKLNDKIEEYNILNKRHIALELYVKSVHRDGLPYKIINDLLPILEDNINNSLSYVSDFTINLTADNNNINGYIFRDNLEHYPFELASGFERTIISMVFRVAMIEISNLSKASFLVYDEGFGTMDTENLLKLNLFLELLKMKFDFVIVISHIDAIKDMVDDYYEFERIDGYSSVEI